MKRKTKTALELLEKEVTKLTRSEALSATGGNALPNDCVFQAIAFAAGKTFEEVKLFFGQHIEEQYVANGGPSKGGDYWGNVYANVGLNEADSAWLAYQFGLTNVGDRPEGATGFSYAGDQSVALLYNYYTGKGHAIVLTGNASGGNYYYYDPQKNITGTISQNDPRFIQSFGFQ